MKQFGPGFHSVRRFVCLAISAVILFSTTCVGQAVTLFIKGGPPTTSTKVSGTGFAAHSAIDIYFDTTDVALVNADGNGAFANIALTVPASAAPGIHWVSAEQRSTGTGAQAAFNVITNWVSQGFTATGKRFNPYENVLNTSTVQRIDLKWSQKLPCAPTSPAVVYHSVYITCSNGALYALNANTGAVRWTYGTPSPFNIDSSPAFDGGSIYFGSEDGNVYAVNANTGAQVWSTQGLLPSGTNAFESSPAVANGLVYLGADDGHAAALQAGTGFPWWYEQVSLFVLSSPAVADGRVVLGSFNGAAGTILALDAATGDKLWSHSAGRIYYSSPAIANGNVYIGDAGGLVWALSAAQGVELWVVKVPGPVQTTPAVANGIVYVTTTDGSVTALNSVNGVKRWSFTSKAGGTEVFSSPAVANGVLYFGSNDANMYALNANDGTLLWQYATTGPLTSPAVVNGVVYVASSFGTVYAFTQTGPHPREAGKPELQSLHPDMSLKLSEQ